MGIGTAAAIAIGVGAAASAGATIHGTNVAKKQERRAASDKNRLTDELNELENTRQEIINPYENVDSLSGMISDDSADLSNPFANLGVATQAAEFQAEQADIALANTLDLLASTGASAGGATALAQAALASKKGISADIQSQEAANEQMKAQGQANLEQLQLAEKNRTEDMELAEAQRIQQADILGKEFMFGQTERREAEQLNRKQAQITGAAQAQVAAQQAGAAVLGSGIGAMGNIVGAGIAASDRKYKKNIKLLGISPSGFKFYSFEYINKALGEGLFQGVMSDEVPSYAVIKTETYDMVDYSTIDVEFKKL